jgi:hypothetical protein
MVTLTIIQFSHVADTTVGIESAVVSTTLWISAPIWIPSRNPLTTAVANEVPVKAEITINHQKY